MSPARKRFLLGALVTLASCLLVAFAVAPWTRAGTLRFELAGRSCSLLEPRGLFALSLLPLVAWAPLWSLADLSWSRRIFSACLRGLVMGMLTVALARPAELGSSQLTSTVFVVDVSSSMSDDALAHVRAQIESARKAQGPHHVALVTFAGEPQRVPLVDGKPVQLARHAQGDATDIERALSLALGLFEPDRLRQLVLFSDGRETRGQLLRAAERLSRQGVILFAESPPGALPQEVAVRDVALPKAIKVGEPFFVRVRLSSTVAQKVRVRLYQNELLNGLEGARDLTLEPGETELTLRSVVRVGGP